jgi:DNA-binding response OmpR family regulator
MTPHLLIIEDDRALGAMLAMHFEDLDFAVTHAEQAQAGLDALRQGCFNLVLLDQQLPDGLG